MKYSLIVIVCFCFANSIACAQTPAATIPKFTFYNFDKNAFTNTKLLSGKFSFFVFFDATCEHCQHAIAYINSHYQNFKNTATYLITLDDKNTTVSFMNRHGKKLINKKNIFMLQDVNNEFVLKFGPKKYPSIFLYSPDGKLLQYTDDEKQLTAISALTKSTK